VDLLREQTSLANKRIEFSNRRGYSVLTQGGSTVQRRLILVFLCSVLLAALSIFQLPAQEPNPNKLVGTWKLISGKYNGQAADFGKEVAIKHVTGSHFTWLRYDSDTKKISQAAGGPCTLKNDSYSETPTYGIGGGFDQIRDKTYTFTWKVEGNKWYSNGEMKNIGLTIDEVWEKVNP
jgi:uncharacterized protein (DUF2147 family)